MKCSSRVSRSNSLLFPAVGFLLLLAVTQGRAAVNFRAQIWPILQKNCVECHGAPVKEKNGQMRNPKGALRLDGASYILKGGSNGEGVTAGDPNESGIYLRTLLPQSHEDAMPPKGKGNPLSFNESETLKQWILEGASFGDWRGNDQGPAPVAAGKPGSGGAVNPGAGVPKPSPEALQKLVAAGALAGPVQTGSPLLRVEWVSGAGQITDKEIALLGPLAGNIAELDLSETKITDEALKLVAKLPRLVWLDLHNTAVTDAGIGHLKPLVNLTYLNLHSTGVSDAALASLTGMRKLRNVYLWQTRVTPETAGRFQKSIPQLSVQME